MSAIIRNWSITALCLHFIAALWIISDPNTMGYWLAKRDIAYDSIWIEYIGDCDCTESLEGEYNDL